MYAWDKALNRACAGTCNIYSETDPIPGHTSFNNRYQFCTRSIDQNVTYAEHLILASPSPFTVWNTCICTVIETLSFYCCFHSALLCTFMLFMLEIVYTLRISHDGVQCNLELEIAKLSMTKGASFQHVRLHTHTCVWTVHGSWTMDCRLPSWNCSSMEDITCYFVSKSQCNPRHPVCVSPPLWEHAEYATFKRNCNPWYSRHPHKLSVATAISSIENKERD